MGLKISIILLFLSRTGNVEFIELKKKKITHSVNLV